MIPIGAIFALVVGVNVYTKIQDATIIKVWGKDSCAETQKVRKEFDEAGIEYRYCPFEVMGNEGDARDFYRKNVVHPKTKPEFPIVSICGTLKMRPTVSDVKAIKPSLIG